MSSPYLALNHCRSVSRSVIEDRTPQALAATNTIVEGLFVRCVENHEFSKRSTALRLPHWRSGSARQCPCTRGGHQPRRCPSLTRHCSIATFDDEDNLALNMTRLTLGGSRFRGGTCYRLARTVLLSSNRPNSASWAPLDRPVLQRP